MNENAKRWVDELRSGKFSQCRHVLRSQNDDGPTYCCLGVANEIGGQGVWDGSSYADDEIDEKRGPAEVLASPNTVKWLGLKDGEGTLRIDGQVTSLVALNDAGRSFNEIAEIIETHADELFV